ncbi:MAG: hypothetical protein NTV72_00665 [Candidatus Taylorbacteria bacterium]|nr:hypothetical protein [Candidatus Taylorbacteria bacterium]
MIDFDDNKFIEIKEKAEIFYKNIGEIYCPYFINTKVVFNSKGLEHLKFKTKNHARSQADQFTRLKLIHLALEVIKNSKTIQGISYTKNFEDIRCNSRTDKVLKDITYYEFIAVMDNKRVRVVLKQIENGPIYFWSIIPFWKINKDRGKRIMNSSNLESD